MSDAGIRDGLLDAARRYAADLAAGRYRTGPKAMRNDSRRL
jgi:hypothetical protein